MSISLKSSSWYRVAPLKLSLRAHIKINRQNFRNQRWYILQDPTSGRHHRYSPAAYLIISLMDGQRTVEKIWEVASEKLGDDGLTQDEVVQLLTQLHQSDLLYGDNTPDFRELSSRADKVARRKLFQSFMNPLAVRIPVLDPDRFLSATLPFVRPLFSWFGALLFVCVVSVALALTGLHWDALTENIADRVLATESLLLLIITYPFVKALHELGHGYAAKIRGGEVHEMGLMFLVFIPVPYVDATSIASFQNKWHRALVGAAGMIVEVFLAALALFAWLNLEPGLAKSFAFNVMIIGGVSTVLFNGNPLLRFDGYYVLSDLIEIPNLGQRSNKYIGYWIQKYLFGVSNAVSPVTAGGEARWFVFYGLASFCYRIFITTTIILFVATKFFFIGVLLGFWSASLIFILPLLKSIKFLFTSPLLREQRQRAYLVSAGFVTLVIVAVTLIPAPLATVTEGIVWANDESVVVAGTDGIVERLVVPVNSRVSKGQALIQMSDSLLPAQVRLLESRLKELNLRYEALQVMDRAEARVVLEKIRHAEAELALYAEREKEMLVSSPSDGVFMLRDAEDLPGKFLHKGQAVAYVVNIDDPTIRVALPHSEIDLVRENTEAIAVRFVEDFNHVLAGRVVRELPNVTNKIPSPALSTEGGGQIFLDPSDSNGETALEMLFHLELKPNTPITAQGIGSRVYIRFAHGSEAIALQAYRRLRQLFLKRFSV